MSNMRVLIFGDSITYGEFDTQGGWAERLKVRYFERYVERPDADLPLVYNLGVAGDVTKRVTERLPGEVNARGSFWSGKSNFALVFAIGVNDSLSREGEEFSTPAGYLRNLQQLYETAQQYTDKILFIGLTPVEDDNSRVNKLYNTDRIRAFDVVLQNFCQQNSVPYVPLLDEFQTRMRRGDKLFVDGLHPNDAGHLLMLENILPAVDKLTS